MPSWKKVIISGSNADLLTVTGSFKGNLTGTASYATLSLTSSFASTASRVNTLTQNVIITGSLTVGSITSGSSEHTITVGPPPAGGTGEGGQILLAAPGGTYTSASMIDNYQDKFRVLRGTNTTSDAYKLQIDLHTGQLQIPNYNSNTAFPGSSVAYLAVDSAGFIITESPITGYTGLFTVPTNPPGQQTLDIQNGIIVNVM